MQAFLGLFGKKATQEKAPLTQEVVNSKIAELKTTLGRDPSDKEVADSIGNGTTVSEVTVLRGPYLHNRYDDQPYRRGGRKQVQIKIKRNIKRITTLRRRYKNKNRKSMKRK